MKIVIVEGSDQHKDASPEILENFLRKGHEIIYAQSEKEVSDIFFNPTATK